MSVRHVHVPVGRPSHGGVWRRVAASLGRLRGGGWRRSGLGPDCLRKPRLATHGFGFPRASTTVRPSLARIIHELCVGSRGDSAATAARLLWRTTGNTSPYLPGRRTKLCPSRNWCHGRFGFASRAKRRDPLKRGAGGSSAAHPVHSSDRLPLRCEGWHSQTGSSDREPDGWAGGLSGSLRFISPAPSPAPAMPRWLNPATNLKRLNILGLSGRGRALKQAR